MDFNLHTGSYERQVDEAVSFSGLSQAFFLEAKVRVLLSLVEERLGSRQGRRIAEIGCGVGSFIHRLVSRGFRLTGTDISLASLARAHREVSGATFSAFDGADLPFPDGCFDAVLAVSVFHHVEPSNRPGLVAEMVRVTRPGGIVAVFEHNPLNPLTRRVVNRCEFDQDAVLLKSGELDAYMRKAGLHDVDRRYLLFFPWSGVFWERLQASISWLPLGAQYVVSGRRPGVPEQPTKGISR